MEGGRSALRTAGAAWGRGGRLAVAPTQRAHGRAPRGAPWVLPGGAVAAPVSAGCCCCALPGLRCLSLIYIWSGVKD